MESDVSYVRMREPKYAPGGPFCLLERRLGLVEIGERGSGRNAISVWTPAFAPCFRIIREEGKYKRLRNADKFQARVSKIRKALAETSTRPVTFHEEVCLGEEVES